MTTTETADTVSPPPADKAPKSNGATRSKPAAGAGAAKPPPNRKRGRGRPSNADFRKVCDDLVERVVGVIALAGIASPRLAYDAEVLLSKQDTIAEELFEQGLRNPKLRKLLESSGAVADYTRLLAIVTGVGIPIAANHGLLPSEVTLLVGAPTPPPRPPKKPKAPKPAPSQSRPNVDAPADTPPGGPSTTESEPGQTPAGFALAFAPAFDPEAGDNGRGT